MAGSWGCSLRFFHVRVCGPGCAKVPLRLHWSLALFLVLEIVGSITHLDVGQLILTIVYSSLGITFSAVSIALAQLSAASCCGCQPSAIIIWPIGGVAIYDRPPSKHRHRIFIALVGLMMCVALAAMWLGLLFAVGCRIGIAPLAGVECEFNPFTRKSAVEPGFNAVSLWVANLSYLMCEYNVYLLAFNLFVPVVPLAAATLLVTPLLMCGLKERCVAQFALFTSCAGLLALFGWWLTVLIISGFKTWSFLTIFTALYLAWRTRALLHAIRSTDADALTKHSLFALTPSADEAGGGASATPVVSNPSLTQNLFGGEPSSTSDNLQPVPKKRGFNPFFGGGRGSSEPPPATNTGALNISITPNQLSQAAAWASNNQQTVAAGASWAANNAGTVAAGAQWAAQNQSTVASGAQWAAQNQSTATAMANVAASAVPPSAGAAAANPFSGNAHLRSSC